MVYDVQENFVKEDHRPPINEEVKEYEKLEQPAYRILKSQTSYFRAQMLLDDSVESLHILISKMENCRRC